MNTPQTADQAGLTKIPEVDGALQGVQDLTDKLISTITYMKQAKTWQHQGRTVESIKELAEAMDRRLRYFVRKFAEFREDADLINEACKEACTCTLCGAQIDWRFRNNHLMQAHNIGNVPSQESKDRLVSHNDMRPKTQVPRPR